MSQSFDMNPREFAKHRRAVESAEESRFMRDKLRENDLPGNDPISTLAADFAHVTDATSFLLSEWDCPPVFRSFIDALVGLAGNRVKTGEWFPASDKQVAARANRRSTKWVQINRTDFSKWQTHHNVAMIDIEDNSYNDGDPIPHRYRVNIARIAAETTLNARTSRRWGGNPGKAIEEAAQTMRDSLPEAPIHKKQRKSRGRDAAQQIAQDLSYSLTKARSANLTNKQTGYLIQLDAQMIENIANIRRELDELEKNSLHSEPV